MLNAMVQASEVLVLSMGYEVTYNCFFREQIDRYFISQHFITKSMSNCTQQSAGSQKGRPIKAGRLYYMKLLLITQSQKQKSNKQENRQTDIHAYILT